MKNLSAVPIVALSFLILAAYAAGYFWAVTPVPVQSLPMPPMVASAAGNGHIPVYQYGDWTKRIYAPLLWLDMKLRPAYWSNPLGFDMVVEP